MFVAHGACLLWKPQLIWLNVISEALVAGAFFAIAFVLAFFVWRRRDIQFGWVFYSFAIFITLCGVTRLMSILTLWVPVYGIDSVIKGVLAVISVGIAAVLLLLLPRILVLPSRHQLQQAYQALENEVRQRRSAEAMVKRFQEIEATEAQVRQAQKMEAIGQLTGGVAHDFNNILTVIIGTIEILGEAVQDRPHLAQIANMIGDAATRGADLTRHLLAFARRQPLQPRNIDVNALVLDAARLLRSTLGEQIEIQSTLAPASALALIDPSQLSTAILNLALNARDAMPNGGTLTIETANVVLDAHDASIHSEVAQGDYVVVAVRDSGAGIPTELVEKVFEPFFTTKEIGKGSGLGLSMVYGFVKQSNGHVQIDSEENNGTTVRLYLPRATGAAETPFAIAVAEAGIAAVDRGDNAILIVEDDPLVREYVVTQIKSLGYTTLAASNAAEALAIIDGPERVDLLFTDVIIPGGLNGHQLAIEALRRRPGLKILYTSGYSETAILHDGRLDEGILLLPKPYLSSDLARMIWTALAS
jgi:signal transduction histidine kinase/CheY-like chemotaxis protein